MPTKLHRIKKRQRCQLIRNGMNSTEFKCVKDASSPVPGRDKKNDHFKWLQKSTLESVGGIYSSQQLEATPGPPNLNFENPKQVGRNKGPSRQHPNIEVWGAGWSACWEE